MNQVTLITDKLTEAKLLDKQGKPFKAMALFKEILKQDKSSLDALLGLARIYKRRNNFTESLELFYQAAELPGVHPLNIQEEIAYCLLRLGKGNEAKQIYLKVAKRLLEIGSINKTTVAQSLLNAKGGKVYIEIGVFACINFLKIVAPIKHAVDPLIRVPQTFKDSETDLYFEIESDRYFKEQEKFLQKNGIDVIFVDGLHTYQQSLADIKNALKYLNKGGVIIVHDCIPKNEAAAHPDMKIAQKTPGFTGGWMGDVWKSIVWLRSNCKDLNVFVLDTDCGLGIITKGEPEQMLSYTDQEILDMSYREMAANKTQILNVKHKDYFKQLNLTTFGE